jgi:hypothetical protein
VRKPSEPPEVTVQLDTTATPSPLQREAWRRLWEKLLGGFVPTPTPDADGHDQG